MGFTNAQSEEFTHSPWVLVHEALRFAKFGYETESERSAKVEGKEEIMRKAKRKAEFERASIQYGLMASPRMKVSNFYLHKNEGAEDNTEMARAICHTYKSSASLRIILQVPTTILNPCPFTVEEL